ncbi:MAG: hypothetical protein H6669_04145 [Ardenticatenaceae bacterium]|nr:hypothetical protein [Ardenticatenaceae bacterium]
MRLECLALAKWGHLLLLVGIPLVDFVPILPAARWFRGGGFVNKPLWE